MLNVNKLEDRLRVVKLQISTDDLALIQFYPSDISRDILKRNEFKRLSTAFSCQLSFPQVPSPEKQSKIVGHIMECT